MTLREKSQRDYGRKDLNNGFICYSDFFDFLLHMLKLIMQIIAIVSKTEASPRSQSFLLA